MSAPKFAINKNDNHKYYFNFVSASGVTLLSSKDYDTKEMCTNHVNDIKECIKEQPANCLQLQKATLSDEFYYTAHDKDGNEVATSKPFDTIEEAEKGENILAAEIELTEIEDHT